MTVRKSAVALGLVFAAVTIALCLYAGSVVPAMNDAVIYWLQVVTGNWSPDKKENLADWQFILGVVLALTLNLGTIAAIITGVVELARQRSTKMNLANAFIMKDASVKQQIVEALPPDQLDVIRPIIEDGFKKGAERWEKEYLPLFFSEEEIQRLLRFMREEHSF